MGNCVLSRSAGSSYPIGSIYISINSTNPSTYFGGTWTQLTGDAYLKIVTTNAGEYAGTSSEHKIPITSMPAHSHGIPNRISKYNNGGYVVNTSGYDQAQTCNTNSAGGGEAYYPYYYGIYAWVRTA